MTFLLLVVLGIISFIFSYLFYRYPEGAFKNLDKYAGRGRWLAILLVRLLGDKGSRGFAKYIISIIFFILGVLLTYAGLVS